MKKETMIIFAAAGLGLYVISRVLRGMPLFGAAPAPTATGAARAVAVDNSGFWGNSNATVNDHANAARMRQGAAVAEVYDPAGYIGTTQ